MIQYSSYSLKSSDGLMLHSHCWRSDENVPFCSIVLVHGLGGHGLRYEDWAIKLANRGCVVFCVDLRGHGQSEGRKGDAKNLQKYLSDIEVLLNYIQSTSYSGLPRFIYGNSLGGLLSVFYMENNYKMFRGGILSSPWFKLTNPPPTVFMKSLNWLAKLMPLYNLKTGVSSKQLRSNPTEQEKARQDPYVHRVISMRLFYAVYRLTNRYHHQMPLLNVPTLCIHGKKDPVTDAIQTEKFVEAQGCKSELLLLNEALHEIHLEPESTIVFDKIMSWIKHRIN